MDNAQAAELCSRIIANIERVIIGKREVVEKTLVVLMVGGHLLFEDVPGVGKTMLGRAIAASIGCKFRRIQFTPDLLPSDVTGVSIFNQKAGEFEFREGPVFAGILLADEVNRASPRTQASLLEAMEEGQVTVDGTTYSLPKPSLVVATDNPIEYEGVYPLPESQLDRFLMRVHLGYPSREAEIEVVKGQLLQHPLRRNLQFRALVALPGINCPRNLRLLHQPRPGHMRTSLRKAGRPRRAIRSSSSRTTRLPEIDVSGIAARHSRVASSTTLRTRNRRPW